ncbi:MAG TPA: hypothetical protein VGF36_17815 [Rhodopila sp.]
MNAVVRGPRCNGAGVATGPLAGMGLAVKDLIHISGGGRGTDLGLVVAARLAGKPRPRFFATTR